MSFDLPERSRVQSIKNKFENLKCVQSPNAPHMNCANEWPKTNKKNNFRRSATSIDFLKNRSAENSSNKSVDLISEIITKSSAVVSDDDSDTLRPLKEIKENIGTRFNRHTNDPVKRSSIRRSPAFRVGDKTSKSVLLKNNATPAKNNKEPIEIPKNHDESQNGFSDVGLTDTLKAVLKQPLPSGPPPKKPPRTFADAKTSSHKVFNRNKSNETSDIINKNIRKNLQRNGVFRNEKTEIKPTAKKLIKNNILKCIPCSSVPIYDVVKSQRQSEVIENNFHPKTTLVTQAVEHMYMEPFAHLELNKSVNKTNGNGNHRIIAATCDCQNNKSPDSESFDSSLLSYTPCTSDDHSLSDLSNDIHYMCTVIEPKTISVDAESSNSNDSDQGQITSNTYNEINILVNAAFDQQHSSGIGMNNIETLNDYTSEINQKQQSSIKLHRTLTEKRKEYIRRVSTIKLNEAQCSSYGSLHRTFKSPVFKTFSLDQDSTKIENSSKNSFKKGQGKSESSPSLVNERLQQFKTLEKENNNLECNHSSDCEEDTLDGTSFHQKLFQVCILIGYNNATRKAYIKSQHPSDIDVPQNIEHLVFPSKHLGIQYKNNQNFSLILTDENGIRIYGYCRRVLPESSDICLPLAYCLVSEIRAPGFYFKVLKEIESRHGQSEAQKQYLLKNIYKLSMPTSGKFVHLKLPSSPRPKMILLSNHKLIAKRLSLDANPKWLKESAIQTANNELKNNDDNKCKNEEPFDLSLINRSLLNQNEKLNRGDEIFISRPNDLRLENTELSDLYKTIGPEILITIFSSLLLERKIILFSENISKLSSCVLALQTLLYPFQWQYTLVTVLPHDLIEICQAPTPLIAGILEPIIFEVEDGIVIDLENRSIIQECGDERSILPNALHESLQVSLRMVDLLNQGKMLSSVLIAEAFLRFFIELFLGYNRKYFDKREFIDAHSSNANRLFLEWFIETAMFKHFLGEKFNKNENNTNSGFFDFFDASVIEKQENKPQLNMEIIMKNSRIINKKGKTFKERFKDLIGSSNNNNCNELK